MFLLLLFIVASVATTAFGLVLRARQAAHVARHRDAVPPPFAETVSLAEHQRAADYERARLRLGAAAAVFGLVLALFWACFGYDALYAGVAGLVPPGRVRLNPNRCSTLKIRRIANGSCSAHDTAPTATRNATLRDSPRGKTSATAA